MLTDHDKKSLVLPPLVIPPNETKLVLKELGDNFKRSEEKTLKIQELLNQTPVPSVNQLRYAGYHISQVLAKSDLTSDPNIIDQQHLISAYRHCLRAYYDAFDFATTVVVADFRRIVTLYNELLIPIQKFFPAYNDWQVAVNELGQIRNLQEENTILEYARDKTSREHYYEILDVKLKPVFEIYKYLPVMADTLSIQQSLLEKEHAELSERITQETQRAERAEAAQRKSNRIAKLSLTATILALIFAILLVMFDDQIKEIGRSITGKTPVVKGTKSD